MYFQGYIHVIAVLYFMFYCKKKQNFTDLLKQTDRDLKFALKIFQFLMLKINPVSEAAQFYKANYFSFVISENAETLFK